MFSIRKASLDEISIIQAIAQRTWPVAYADMISARQIDYMLEKMYSQNELAEQMLSGHTFLIGSEAGADMGFAGFSGLEEQPQTYKLHKLYVLPEAHGKGLGKLLLNEVYKRTAAAGGTALQLNVNRNNKALNFYKKAGFQIKEAVDLDIGNGFFMNDYVMEKPIVQSAAGSV